MNIVKSRSPFRWAAIASALAGATFAGCSSNSGQNTASSGGDNSATASSTGSGTGSGTGSSGGASGKPLKLAFVTNNSSDFWTIAQRGIEKADAEMENVSIEFKMPTGDVADQTRLVNDLLAKGVDGFAISPVKPADQTTLLNKAAERVLVFTQDSDAPASKRACYVGTDNRAAGRQAGEQIKKSLPKGGKIMLFVGQIDAQNAADRANGIKDALKGSNVSVIDIRTDDTDRAKAKSNVSDALVKYSDLAACVGLWSYNGPAILSAVQAAGKVGKVKIICFDEEDDTLAGIRSGAIDATIVQQPYEFGYQSMKLMAKVLNGDKNAIPANKQIPVATQVINKAGIEAYTAKVNKLRGR